MSIVIKKKTQASIPSVSTDKVQIFVDSADDKLKYKDENGDVGIVASEEEVDSKIAAIPSQTITNNGYSNMPTGTWTIAGTGVTSSFEFTSDGFIIGAGLARYYDSATSWSLDISPDGTTRSVLFSNFSSGRTGYPEQGNNFCVFIPKGNYVRMSLNTYGGDGSVALHKYIYIGLS